MKKKIKKRSVYYILLLLSVIFTIPTLSVSALEGQVNLTSDYFPLITAGQTLTEEKLLTDLEEISIYIQDKLDLYNINAYYFLTQKYISTTENTSSFLPELMIVRKTYIASLGMSAYGGTINQIRYNRNGSSAINSSTTNIDLSLPLETIQSNLDIFFSTFSYTSTSGPTLIYGWDYNTFRYNSFLYSTNYTNNLISSTIQNELSIYDTYTIETYNTQTPLYSLNDYYSNLVFVTDEDYNSDQIYSFDYIIEDTNIYDLKFSFYKKEEITTYLYDSFITYSLYEENGLYHWEQTQNCIVDGDYTYTYVNDKYKGTVNDVSCDYTDGSIKHYFKIIVNNASNYAFPTSSGTENTKYINNIGTNYIMNTFNTADFKYINFTTDLNTWGEYKPFFITSSDIYLDSFDTTTLKFTNYNVYNKIKEYYLYNIDFGANVNRGFWLTYNVPISEQQEQDFINFDFIFGFVPDNLYYYINIKDGTRLNDNVIIIDSNGDPIQVDISPSEDIVLVHIEDISDIFGLLNQFFKKNSMVANLMTDTASYTFNSLNTNTQTFLVASFIIALILGVFSILKRGN